MPVYYLINEDLLSVPEIIEKYKEGIKRIKELEELNKGLDNYNIFLRTKIKKLEDDVEKLEYNKKETDEMDIDDDNKPKKKKRKTEEIY